MPDSQFKRLRFDRRVRRYKKHPRTILPRNEMLRYLRERDIRSWRVLHRKRMPDDPVRYDYEKEFGSWSNAVQQAFGSEITFKLDREYVVKTVWHLGLWTQSKYRTARRKDPATVPSEHAVFKEWGSFGNLFAFARRYNLDCILEKYLKLWRKLGHRPSVEESRTANLRIDEAIRSCGGKNELDALVDGMRKQYERKAGSN